MIYLVAFMYGSLRNRNQTTITSSDDGNAVIGNLIKELYGKKYNRVHAWNKMDTRLQIWWLQGMTSYHIACMCFLWSV